ncbi:MAG: ATP-binding protein [Acidimicrobiales bacterium]
MAERDEHRPGTETRAWMSWSSGKDSAFALHTARAAGVRIVGLLTTLNGDAERVAMHGVRRTLLEAQADRLGLPLHQVDLPSPCPNGVYEEKMVQAMAAAAADGVGTMVFGDLFLDDVRQYREANLAPTPIEAHFPIWGRPTDQLAHEMIDSGLRAVLTCIDLSTMPIELLGRSFDHALLADLPDGVDPCGENGEFHTFVWDGPGFSRPIPVEVGEIVERDGFAFRDVVATST